MYILRIDDFVSVHCLFFLEVNSGGMYYFDLSTQKTDVCHDTAILRIELTALTILMTLTLLVLKVSVMRL